MHVRKSIRWDRAQIGGCTAGNTLIDHNHVRPTTYCRYDGNRVHNYEFHSVLIQESDTTLFVFGLCGRHSCLYRLGDDLGPAVQFANSTTELFNGLQPSRVCIISRCAVEQDEDTSALVQNTI